MQIKDIAYRGVIRLIFFIDVTIASIALPLAALLYFINPESPTLNTKFTLFIFTVELGSITALLAALPVIIALYVLSVFIKAAVLYWTAQNTRIGQINIGRLPLG